MSQLKYPLQIARKHPLFKSLDVEQFDILSDSARLHELRKGETLFLQDCSVDRFFLIIQGGVKLYRVTNDGRETVLNVLGEMECVGEAEIFLDTSGFPFNAAAVDSTRLISFSSHVYKALLQTSNACCLGVIAAMAARLQERSCEIEALSKQTASHRVISFLLSQIEETEHKSEKVEIKLPITKRLIAARLSMQPETFSRIIAGFRQKGLLEVDGNRLSINCLNDLRQMV